MFEKLIAAMMALATIAEAQSSGIWTVDDGPQGIFAANSNINQWLNPNAFIGILLTIIIFWVTSCVLSLMQDIETPRIMLEKDLDWGKVEKVDE